MTPGEPLQVTSLVVDVLRQLGIRYLVGGSLASSLHGIPRATQDVDLVVDLQDDKVLPFVRALRGSFYVDEDRVRGSVRRRSSFNVIHLETMLKVDIFLLKDDPASQMARREAYRVSDQPNEELFVASAEDTILRKLLWFKLGGSISDRQWQDVLGILMVRGDSLDRAYLETQAAALGSRPVGEDRRGIPREIGKSGQCRYSPYCRGFLFCEPNSNRQKLSERQSVAIGS